MKTLIDVKQDMSDLFELLKNNKIDIQTASEMANVTGKFLKAEQLILARDVFLNNRKITVIESKENE